MEDVLSWHCSEDGNHRNMVTVIMITVAIRCLTRSIARAICGIIALPVYCIVLKLKTWMSMLVYQHCVFCFFPNNLLINVTFIFLNFSVFRQNFQNNLPPHLANIASFLMVSGIKEKLPEQISWNESTWVFQLS